MGGGGLSKSKRGRNFQKQKGGSFQKHKGSVKKAKEGGEEFPNAREEVSKSKRLSVQKAGGKFPKYWQEGSFQNQGGDLSKARAVFP